MNGVTVLQICIPIIVIVLGAWASFNTFKQQQRWVIKKDVYVEAIEIINQYLLASGWKGPEIPEGYRPLYKHPSFKRINDCIGKLYLVTPKKEIPELFLEATTAGASLKARGKFIKEIRKDLYGKKQDSLGNLSFRLPFGIPDNLIEQEQEEGIRRENP